MYVKYRKREKERGMEMLRFAALIVVACDTLPWTFITFFKVQSLPSKTVSHFTIEFVGSISLDCTMLRYHVIPVT